MTVEQAIDAFLDAAMREPADEDYEARVKTALRDFATAIIEQHQATRGHAVFATDGNLVYPLLPTPQPMLPAPTSVPTCAPLNGYVTPQTAGRTR